MERSRRSSAALAKPQDTSLRPLRIPESLSVKKKRKSSMTQSKRNLVWFKFLRRFRRKKKRKSAQATGRSDRELEEGGASDRKRMVSFEPIANGDEKESSHGVEAAQDSEEEQAMKKAAKPPMEDDEEGKIPADEEEAIPTDEEGDEGKQGDSTAPKAGASAKNDEESSQPDAVPDSEAEKLRSDEQTKDDGPSGDGEDTPSPSSSEGTMDASEGAGEQPEAKTSTTSEASTNQEDGVKEGPKPDDEMVETDQKAPEDGPQVQEEAITDLSSAAGQENDTEAETEGEEGGGESAKTAAAATNPEDLLNDAEPSDENGDQISNKGAEEDHPKSTTDGEGEGQTAQTLCPIDEGGHDESLDDQGHVVVDTAPVGDVNALKSKVEEFGQKNKEHYEQSSAHQPRGSAVGVKPGEVDEKKPGTVAELKSKIVAFEQQKKEHYESHVVRKSIAVDFAKQDEEAERLAKLRIEEEKAKEPRKPSQIQRLTPHQLSTRRVGMFSPEKK